MEDGEFELVHRTVEKLIYRLMGCSTKTPKSVMKSQGLIFQEQVRVIILGVIIDRDECEVKAMTDLLTQKIFRKIRNGYKRDSRYLGNTVPWFN